MDSTQGALVNRTRQCLAQIPTHFEARDHILLPYAVNLGPFTYGATDAIKVNDVVRAFIARLFPACRPAAIAWLVMTVIVNSIKGHAFWWMSHIRKKILEREPSFADRNPARAIVFVLQFFLVKAPTPHVHPDAIDATSSTKSVPSMRGADDLTITTSTGLRLSGHQSASTDETLSSADTYATPQRARLSGRTQFDYAVSAERHSSQVFCVCAAFSHRKILPHVLRSEVNQ